MSTKPHTIAVFDFDGTIYRGDSFSAFIRYTHSGVKGWMAYLKCLPWLLLYLLGAYPNHRAKERLFSTLYKGYPAKTLEQKGHAFAIQMLPNGCYPKAIDTIRWHQKQGHQLYLLTASSDIWLKAWAAQFDMIVMGTKWEVVNGQYTGHIEGQNCYGTEKRRRLEELIQRLKPDQVYGYGDHPSDRAFLDLTTHSFFGRLQ